MHILIKMIKRVFLNPTQLTIFLSSCSLLILSSNFGFAETHPIWNPTEYIKFCNSSEKTSNISVIQNKVSSLLSMTDAELRNLLNNSGRIAGASNTCADDAGSNITTVEDTYILALLYHLTANSDYAHRAAVLLDRYAEVFPNWPKDYTESQNHGIWTNWFHLDLQRAMGLALAYDLIYDSSEIESIGSSKIEIENFLTLIVQCDFNYRFYIHNMASLRPLAIVVFGRVLNDPELVHVGYWYLSKLLHEGYNYDGFMIDGSYSYHHICSHKIVDSCCNGYDVPFRELHAFYLDGYSDPVPFSYTSIDVRYDPSRYDNYNFEEQHGDHLDRMVNTLTKTQLPNNQNPILNDTHYYDPNSSSDKGIPPSSSLLMGGLGHAIIAYGSGANQTQIRFDFSHTTNHHHKDALHLIYYDKQEEVIGGTGYSQNDRTWNTSTKNANLVIVNGAEQKSEYFTDKTESPYIPGGVGSAVTRDTLPSNTNKHNNINLFEPAYKTFGKVQAVEANGLDAYSAEATRYLRLLALVNISGNDMYLVDVFRLKGGTQYDWCIHGGHNTYSASISLSMGNDSGSFGSISFSDSATTAGSWNGTFTYSGSGVHEKFSLIGEPGTSVYKGVAPRSVSSGGNQDYIVARRTAGANDDVNYMATHEVYTTSPHIQSIEKLEFDGNDGTAVGMKVTLDNGIVDYIVHTLDEGPSYPEHRVTGINNFAIKGRFAHVRVTNGNVIWMNLVQGSHLSYNSKIMSSNDGDYSYRGMVTKVNRKAEGASENSFEVDTTLPGNGVLDGKTLIVTWGNGWKWGYKIKSTTGNKIVTDDEPGFNYNGGGVDMQYFPVPEHLGLMSFPGPVSFLISGTAVMDENGIVIDTDSISNRQIPYNLRL